MTDPNEKIYYPEETVSSKYEKGELDEIRKHLLEFVERHAEDIRSRMTKKSETLLEALKHVVLKKGGIHLPTEMADQIRAINREVWYRGEEGKGDAKSIKEDWVLKYSGKWRQARVVEILYVADKILQDLTTLVEAA